MFLQSALLWFVLSFWIFSYSSANERLICSDVSSLGFLRHSTAVYSTDHWLIWLYCYVKWSGEKPHKFRTPSGLDVNRGHILGHFMLNWFFMRISTEIFLFLFFLFFLESCAGILCKNLTYPPTVFVSGQKRRVCVGFWCTQFIYKSV